MVEHPSLPAASNKSPLIPVLKCQYFAFQVGWHPTIANLCWDEIEILVVENEFTYETWKI